MLPGVAAFGGGGGGCGGAIDDGGAAAARFGGGGITKGGTTRTLGSTTLGTCWGCGGGATVREGALASEDPLANAGRSNAHLPFDQRTCVDNACCARATDAKSRRAKPS